VSNRRGWVPARVLEASDRSYAEAVLPLLDRARKEIVLSLYLMEPNDTAGPDHPVNRFLEALLKARQRGVGVRIFLNTNFRFRPKTEVGRGSYFERLLEAGVEVTTLLPARRLHDKLIIIDGRYVVEGSTNWSVSALQENYESSSIIDSPPHAQKKLERIASLTLPPPPRESEIDSPLATLPETVEFPMALFEKDKLPKMVRLSDIRALNLYLILLGQRSASQKSEMTLDLEVLGRSLALPPHWERSRVRRQMIKTLRKLALRYRLIEVDFPFGRDAKIRLHNFPGEKIRIPGRALEPSSLSNESTGVTFLALAREILKKEGVGIDSLSAPQLEKRFAIGRSTVVHARSRP